MRKKVYRQWRRGEGTGEAHTGIGQNRRNDKLLDREPGPLAKHFAAYRKRHGQ